MSIADRAPLFAAGLYRCVELTPAESSYACAAA
jgi:hypothetical protein